MKQSNGFKEKKIVGCKERKKRKIERKKSPKKTKIIDFERDKQRHGVR